MPDVASSAGPVEFFVAGTGTPVTLFVHGLAGSIADTRPFGSGVPGSRVFLHLRGHGDSAAPDAADTAAWSYDGLADDVAAVADAVDPTQAFGVSLGAGALLAHAVRGPGRFDRLVLALPAAVDDGRPADVVAHAAQLADAVDAGDTVAVQRALVRMQPASVRRRPDVALWSRRQADALVRRPVARALRTLPGQAPVADLAALGAVKVPVLVVAQRDDPWHPVEAAERLAAALPDARLEVFDQPLLWGGRAALRALLAGFLAGPTPAPACARP